MEERQVEPAQIATMVRIESARKLSTCEAWVQRLSRTTLVLLVVTAVSAQQHEHGSISDEKLGTVSFEISCNADAQARFNRAVSLLHSFEFARAIDGFHATLAADPTCGIAEWGIALS